jgi:hypothetical protein
MRIMRHDEVCGSPYDIFAVSVETRHWGFGFKFADYRSSVEAKREYGLRVLFWRWHLVWRIS